MIYDINDNNNTEQNEWDKIPQTTVDNVMQIMITSINKEFYSQ